MCQVSQTEHFAGEIPLRLCFCMHRAKHEHSIGQNKHSHLVETSHATTINTKHNEHDKLKESRTQSTQAVFCTTICIKLFLESNTNQIIWNNSQGQYSSKNREFNTPNYKEELKISEQNEN